MSRGALLVLTFDAVIKVLRLEIVAQSAVELGRTRLRVCTASQQTSRHLRAAPGLPEEAPSSTQFLRWDVGELERKSEVWLGGSDSSAFAEATAGQKPR